jgi:hypothetical protein
MSRRHFLADTLALAGAASIAAAAPLPTRKCRPLITGALWSYSSQESARWGLSGWKDELEQQAALGFNLLWVANAPVALSNKQEAVRFCRLMDLCADRKLKVILGTGASPLWHQKLDLQKELGECGKNISHVGERLKGHPAFWAWYIPHEIYMFWGQGDAYIQQLYPGLVERCKRAANLLVTLSPFFILDRDKVYGDFRFNEPEEYAGYWTGLIRKSGLDIIMLQDSGEHFSYVTKDMRRPFFDAMAEACRKVGREVLGQRRERRIRVSQQRGIREALRPRASFHR